MSYEYMYIKIKKEYCYFYKNGFILIYFSEINWSDIVECKI